MTRVSIFMVLLVSSCTTPKGRPIDIADRLWAAGDHDAAALSYAAAADVATTPEEAHRARFFSIMAHRAAGGPVLPHKSYLVGENGPEILRMGSGSGIVSPGVSGASGGGGSLTINVNTPVLTPGGAQALADAIAPAITRWQQQRGV